jgi:uncharacterized LabA/DUF88 family protein
VEKSGIHQIAVYWDFDNIHFSVRAYEQRALEKNRFGEQDSLVAIPAIMEFLNSLGDISINKAYANWSIFQSYREQLLNYSMDLIQLFPRGGHAKNGADIRMSIDITEDVHFSPHIDCFVVIGGDSDYISVAQKVRQKGKYVIGIGEQDSTNPYWVKACNEFKYYRTLLLRSESPQKNIEVTLPSDQTMDMGEAGKLLINSLLHLGVQNGEDRVKKATLKPILRRFDPTFDEGNYGFTTLGEFLNYFEQQGYIVIEQAKDDHLIALSPKALSETCWNQVRENKYLEILKKQGIVYPDVYWRRKVAPVVYEVLNDLGKFRKPEHFMEKLRQRISADYKELDDIKQQHLEKIYALYKRTHVLHFHKDRSISIHFDLHQPDDINEMVDLNLLARIVKVGGFNLDDSALCELLFGDIMHLDDVAFLKQKVERSGLLN